MPAIQQRRIVAYLNQFVVHTVRFLNRFSIVCEEVCTSLLKVPYSAYFQVYNFQYGTFNFVHFDPPPTPQKLANISLRIQQIETTLCILEAKVSYSL